MTCVQMHYIKEDPWININDRFNNTSDMIAEMIPMHTAVENTLTKIQ